MNREALKTIAWTVCVCFMMVLPLSIILYYDGPGPLPALSAGGKDVESFGVNLINDGVFTWLIMAGLIGGLVYSLMEGRDRIQRKRLARVNRTVGRI